MGVLVLFWLAYRRASLLLLVFSPLVCGLAVTFGFASLAVGFYTNDYTTANENIIGAGWVHLAWVYDSTDRVSRLYRNGVAVGAPFSHSGGIDTTGTGGVIGNASTAFGLNMGINATLDEVRITNVTRSAQWLAAEALNQSDPGASYTVSAEQTP